MLGALTPIGKEFDKDKHAEDVKVFVEYYRKKYVDHYGKEPDEVSIKYTSKFIKVTYKETGEQDA